MTPERWQHVNDLLQSALECEPSQRAAFLDKACANDPSLRRELEALIASDEQAADFLETPAIAPARQLLADDQAKAIVGRHIGPYKILREIGHGGMGAVYLAERADDEYQKQVAIKLVKRGMDTDAILGRFRNERQILAQLDHPNIAKLLDGGTTADGLPYFVMDYIEGHPIDVYCDTHKLSTIERLTLFCTVCSAVHYAHQNHVVHRDLKPSNILVTAEGVPKLLDFGIAKLLSPELSSQAMEPTATALRPMTPKYASPEQVRGEPTTTASDIYSLGVLLYELLTGHHPYCVTGCQPQEIRRIISEVEPEKPSTIIGRVEEVSGPEGTAPITLTPESVSKTREGQPEELRRRLAGDLDHIVLMAIRKEPERRYASVAQFSEDIHRHLEGLPVIARKDTLWYRSAKFLERDKVGVRPVALVAALLVLLGIGLYLLTWRGRPVDTAIDSIAVLPLVNVSADSNAEYLSDGITESLINSLSQLPRLRVVPRSLVYHYKGRALDPQEVGRSLGVRAVLAGRVLQRGDDLSIQTELIDVKKVSQLWGEQYNRKLSDILAVQEEISRAISQKLRLRLSDEEKRLLAKRYTGNPEAYQLYVKGRYFWNKMTAEGLKKGVEYFEQAIERDPRYALAYAGLADSYNVLALHGVPPKEVLPKAKEAALKALEIDDALAEVHTSLGRIKWRYDWDWPGAEKELKRAIELNPNYATAHQWYGDCLSTIGRFDEALAEMKRAQELEPLSLIISLYAGWVFYHARQYDRAIEQYRKALEMDPDFAVAHLLLGKAYHQKGMHEAAIAEFREKSIALSGAGMEAVAYLGCAYAASGRKGAARRVLDEFTEQSKRGYVSPYCMAAVYNGLGAKDQAFEWLERAYEDRDPFMIRLKVEPMWDNLRSDARFADLLRRIGLPI